MEQPNTPEKPKNRFKERYTTIIGAVIMLAAVGLWVTSFFMEFEITNLELGLAVAIGWIFLRAKDSLIEGIISSKFKK